MAKNLKILILLAALFLMVAVAVIMLSNYVGCGLCVSGNCDCVCYGIETDIDIFGLKNSCIGPSVNQEINL